MKTKNKALCYADWTIGIFYGLMLVPIGFGIWHRIEPSVLKNYFANVAAVIAALYGGRAVFMSGKHYDSSDTPVLSFIYSAYFLAVYIVVSISLLFEKKPEISDEIFFWLIIVVGITFIVVSLIHFLNDRKCSILRTIFIPFVTAALVVVAVSHFSADPWLLKIFTQVE